MKFVDMVAYVIRQIAAQRLVNTLPLILYSIKVCTIDRVLENAVLPCFFSRMQSEAEIIISATASAPRLK